MSELKGLIYVGDPMCSWCWGFAPEIEELANDHAVELVVGGLRPGPMAQPLDDRLAEALRHHWLEIERRTSQELDVSFLERRDGWTYDTEPAAIAVVLMRQLHPGRALEYFTTIQRAFYANGEDVTDFEVLAGLGSGFEIDQGQFRSSLESLEAKKAAWADFTRVREWGISGFPALVGELEDGRLALLARGWAKADVIRERIESLGPQK